MLQGGRRVLALLAVLGAVFVAPGVPSAQDADAGAFLESMTQGVFAKLDDPSLSRTEKEQDLRNLFKQNFDVPAISRFVLGKYWRKASTAKNPHSRKPHYRSSIRISRSSTRKICRQRCQSPAARLQTFQFQVANPARRLAPSAGCEASRISFASVSDRIPGHEVY